MSVPLKAHISRGNPDKVFDLIEKVGGGTYGDVFKVGWLGSNRSLSLYSVSTEPRTYVLQARVIATGDLAAVKVVKIEPGKTTKSV